MFWRFIFIRCILALGLDRSYSSDFTMTVADSPYIVHQDTVFAANLVIENGAEIIFNDNVDIEARSNLNIGCNDIDTTPYINRGLANPATYTHIHGNITKATASNLGYTLGGHNVMGRFIIKSNSNSNEMKICNTKFSSLWMALKIFLPQYTDTIVDNCEFTNDIYVTYYDPSQQGITTYITDSVITQVKYLNNRGNTIYENNYIDDYNQFCVNANNMCFDVSVRHCTISRSKTDTDKTQKCLVTQNYIGDYDKAILNNSFADCGTAIWTSGPTQNEFYYVQNTFTNIADKGIWFTGTSLNLYIIDNTFENNDFAAAISATGSSVYPTNLTMTNNVFVNNNASSYLVDIGMGGLGETVVDGNIFLNNMAFSAVIDMQCGRTTAFTNNILKNNGITASLTYMDALSFIAYDGVVFSSYETYEISSVLCERNIFENNRWFTSSVYVQVYNAEVTMRYNLFNDSANRGGVRFIGNQQSVNIEYNTFAFRGQGGRAIFLGESGKLIDPTRSDIRIQFNNFYDSNLWKWFIFSEGTGAITANYNYFDALQDVNQISNKTAGQCIDANADDFWYIDDFIDITFDPFYIEPIGIDFENGVIDSLPVVWCLDSAFNCTYHGNITVTNCAQVTLAPTVIIPTSAPSVSTINPTLSPSDPPVLTPPPTNIPTDIPSLSPTNVPSLSPTYVPSVSPSYTPTKMPTNTPTQSPTKTPTASPSADPTSSPSVVPTESSSSVDNKANHMEATFSTVFILLFICFYYFV